HALHHQGAHRLLRARRQAFGGRGGAGRRRPGEDRGRGQVGSEAGEGDRAMNEIFDRIMEMPPRQRVLMLVGGVGLIFFVYAYFLYWPRGAAISSKETQVAAKRVERDRKAVMVANLEQAKKEVNDLKAALNEAVAQLPDTKEIPDLLSNISSVGRDAGLEIA